MFENQEDNLIIESRGKNKLISPKESYKKWHPDQFSDSRIVKKAKLGKELFEYYLSKISSHSQEKDFEIFCRALLEKEICPNLLPQTGPTGGGDSKVDTETYPVAEQISESWLYGTANRANTERWAFAISSKADWRSKVKSDVEKIVKTSIDGRNYKKIFFVSNQRISDKKRAKIEDELRKQYEVDIRVLSMDWILEAVFRNDENKRIAVETLGLSESLVDEKNIGDNDYRRQKELEKIENSLKHLDDMKSSEIICAAKRSLILFRELEKDEQETIACIERYNRLAEKYGTVLDKADALYESAWTIYWWYESKEVFYSYYQRFEQYVVNERTAYLFEKLCTLWTNLFAITLRDVESGIDVDSHRLTIESIYEYLISDDNKPNTILSASNSFQRIRVFRGDSLDDIVEDYIDIVKKSEKSLEVDVEIIAKMIQQVPVFQDAQKYDLLFDLLTERLASEKHDLAAAKMYAERGSKLIDVDTVKALAFLSKAVFSFHNESNKNLLKQTVYLMAHLYEKLGLYWAARNYFFYVVTLCLNDYMKRGEISPFFALAANELKWIEFMQGRVVFSSEMHFIEVLARNAYPGSIPEDKNNYDALFPFLFFKTPFEKICRLEKLPNYLESKGLSLAAMACRYELGYYDDELLSANNESKENVDSYMKMWANQPAWDQIRFNPWYGFEDECTLQSRIMGCTFSVSSENDMFAIEFGITLLAMLECLLGTGFYNGLISRASMFLIETIKVSQAKPSIEVEYNTDNPSFMKITVSEFEQSDFQVAHELYSRKMLEIASIIISALLSSSAEYEKLKKLIDDEFVVARANIFTDSLFYGFSTFGLESFSFERLMNGYDKEPIMRTEKAILHEEECVSEKKENEEINVIYEVPPEFNIQQYRNDEILRSDIINIPLWDTSEWRGVFYIIIPNYPPMLSLIFKSEYGLKIFDEWIEKLGKDDVGNVIGIRIIKGIDFENPNWYRIGIGENSFFSGFKGGNNSLVISPGRMHTMQPQNDNNLRAFEIAQTDFGEYIICPSVIRDGNEYPEVHFERQIFKHRESIKILDAYELVKTDVLAAESIIPTDRPFIPPGYEKCDFNEILNSKRDHS